MKTPKKKSPVRGVLEVFVGLALYLMVAFVFINAVLRYVFHSGWALSEELSRWLFVWVTFLGAIVGYIDDAHVGVDLVISHLKGNTKLIWSMVGQICAMVSLVFAAWGSWKYFLRTMTVPAPASRLPQGILTVSVLIATVSMAVLCGKKMVETVQNHRKEKGGEA